MKTDLIALPWVVQRVFEPTHVMDVMRGGVQDRERTPICDAVATFNDLPDSAYVPLPVVVSLFGISPATVWRWVSNGSLPQPKRFSSRATRWNVGLLREYLTNT